MFAGKDVAEIAVLFSRRLYWSRRWKELWILVALFGCSSRTHHFHFPITFFPCSTHYTNQTTTHQWKNNDSHFYSNHYSIITVLYLKAWKLIITCISVFAMVIFAIVFFGTLFALFTTFKVGASYTIRAAMPITIDCATFLTDKRNGWIRIFVIVIIRSHVLEIYSFIILYN